MTDSHETLSVEDGPVVNGGEASEEEDATETAFQTENTSEASTIAGEGQEEGKGGGESAHVQDSLSEQPPVTETNASCEPGSGGVSVLRSDTVEAAATSKSESFTETRSCVQSVTTHDVTQSSVQQISAAAESVTESRVTSQQVIVSSESFKETQSGVLHSSVDSSATSESFKETLSSVLHSSVDTSGRETLSEECSAMTNVQSQFQATKPLLQQDGLEPTGVPSSAAPPKQTQPHQSIGGQITELNQREQIKIYKIYQPPPDSEMEVTPLLRRKKMFSSSSFYEEPNAIYPTVEEQVELCRKIAGSLSDSSNVKSRGANMFFKRVKRAEKWVHQASPELMYASEAPDDGPTPDPGYIKVSKGPPKLKLILDPRQLKDMKLLRQEGQNINEHTAVSPEICLDLVRDLNCQTGRGGQLFARRKKKSEEWVVDEQKVRALLAQRQTPEPPVLWNEPQNYVGTYVDVRPDTVAESVIKAAEFKMTFPPPEPPVFVPPPPPPPPQAPPPLVPPSRPLAQVPQFKPSLYCPGPYKPRAPRGWAGSTIGGAVAPQFPSYQPLAGQTFYEATISQPTYQTTEPSVTASAFPVARQYSFQNFNKVAKPWLGGAQYSLMATTK